MSHGFRRLILKPPTVSPEQWSKLGDALTEGIDAQNQAAQKSPQHVLRFVSPLHEETEGFCVEHEPAAGLALGRLFDPQAPRATPQELFAATVAFVTALSAVHSLGGQRRVVHGGLCPGVILEGTDGLMKLTDFGFAPAICRTLGVKAYLNLAVGPHPNASGAWEVLAADVDDRDDRLCAFIDPDKYGQETLASFEPGSDIIAAGLLLYILGEHVHPYLASEPGAHRVLDMAPMMAWGYPIQFSRKELRESTDLAVATCCRLITKMLSPLPSKRSTSAELAEQLLPFAPRVNPEIAALERWLAHLEELLQNQDWSALEIALADRPRVDKWPPPLLARVDSIAESLRVEQAADARRTAIAAAEQWFARLQTAFMATRWDTVGDLLSRRPQIEPWPANLHRGLNEIHAAYVAHQLKAVEDARREREAVARQPNEVRARLEQAEAAAKQGQWVKALDTLAQRPQPELPDVREEAAQLATACRARLEEAVRANAGLINRHIHRQTDAIIRDVVAQHLLGLVAPEGVSATAEFAGWVSGGSAADCRAQISVGLRRIVEHAVVEPTRVEVTVRLNAAADGAQLSGGQDEFRHCVVDGLLCQIASLQKAQLSVFAGELSAGLFPKATVQPDASIPRGRLAATILLLGEEVSEGVLRCDLDWRSEELSWVPTDPAAFAAEALRVATAVSRLLVQGELPVRCPALRPYVGLLRVDLNAVDRRRPGTLPKPVMFDVHVSILTGPDSRPQLLHTVSAACHTVGSITFDASLGKFEARFSRWLGQVQERNRRTLVAELIQRIPPASRRIQLSARPARVKVPADEVVFELRPEGGEGVVLAARWDPATLAYRLPVGWEETLRALDQLPPTPVVAVGPAPPPPDRLAPAPSTDRLPKPASKRRTWLRVGLVALVVAIVALVYIPSLLWPHPGPTSSQAPLNDTVGPTGPSAEQLEPNYPLGVAPSFPSWDEMKGLLAAKGYKPGSQENDRDTGYPLRLKDDQQHELLLVSIPPGAKLWQELDDLASPQTPQPADDSPRLTQMLRSVLDQQPQPWRMFYIDAAELDPVDTFQQAQQLATKMGRQLPRRSEWVLAVLKLGAEAPSDFYGGLREWCDDDDGEVGAGGTNEPLKWVCGGYTEEQLLGRTRVVIPDRPQSPYDLRATWEWLNSPLVIQRRPSDFGDARTGVRTILRVNPPDH